VRGEGGITINGMMNTVSVILINIYVDCGFPAEQQMPTACSTLAAYLRASERNTVTIHIVDGTEKYLSTGKHKSLALSALIDEVVSIVKNTNSALVVGISMKWGSEECAARIVTTLETIDPTINDSVSGRVIVLGGIIPTTCGAIVEPPFNKCLSVAGEGEYALTKIVHRVRESVRSTVATTATTTAAAAVVVPISFADIESIRPTTITATSTTPPPTRPIKDKVLLADQCLDWSDSLHPNVYNRHHALETSRGCSWSRCSFCTVSHMYGGGKKWRRYATSEIIKQLLAMLMVGKREFFIKDSDFFGENLEETIALVDSLGEAIASAGLMGQVKFTRTQVCADDPWRQMASAEENDRRFKLFSKMKDIGFDHMYLGVESASPAQLKRYNKRASASENDKACQILRGLGFEVQVGFIFFDKQTTLEDIRINLAFIEKHELYRTSHLFDRVRVYRGSRLDTHRTETTSLRFVDQVVPYEFDDPAVRAIFEEFHTFEATTKEQAKAAEIDNPLLRYDLFTQEYEQMKRIVNKVATHLSS
jgi:hypothetical protein